MKLVSAMWRSLIVATFLLGIESATAAQFPVELQPPGSSAPLSNPEEAAKVTTRLVPETVSAGGKVKLEISIELAPGYHTYDIDQPEEKALASRITLEQTGPLQGNAAWSGTEPEQKLDPVLQKMIYLHHQGPTWTREFQVPANTEPGTFPISGQLRFTVCNDQGCLPLRNDKFEVLLTVTAAAAGTESDESAVLESVVSEPMELPAGTEPTVPVEGKSDGKLTVVRSQTEVGSLAAALGFGFLAGLILNIMPCVLPVISLKIYGFVKQAGEHPERVKLLGLAFAGGILSVFLVLGGLMVAFGWSWGEWFQKEPFVIGMTGLLVAFAMGMFDVYTIRLPGFMSEADAATAHREGVLASFSKGILATLLSTPCSGPFLAATATYAATQLTFPENFVVFAAMGFGMASPYILLAWNPGWMKIMPRPGEWMNTFKEAMGFVILGTAIWVLWTKRSNGDLVLWTVAFGIIVGMASWLYGRLSDPLASKFRQNSAFVSALLLIGVGGYFCFGYMYEPRETTPVAAKPTPIKSKGWEPFDLERVMALRAAGTTVVVDWTADW